MALKRPKYLSRYMETSVRNDLNRKMVFIGGPRPTIQDLLVYGGFPEPCILQSEKETRRWGREYRHRVIMGDLSDLENVQDVGIICGSGEKR